MLQDFHRLLVSKQMYSLLFLSELKWDICCAVHSCCSAVIGQNPRCSTRTLWNLSLPSFLLQNRQLLRTWHERLSTTYPWFLFPSFTVRSLFSRVSPPSDLPQPLIILIKKLGRWIRIVVMGNKALCPGVLFTQWKTQYVQLGATGGQLVHGIQAC